MPSELEQIKEIFDSFEIPLSMEWLESCVEWCKDGNIPPNYTLKNLQNMVYEQWLILDLRDVEICSLPRNLSMEKKCSLNNIYYLQLMQVVDISKPKLWQLQRIRNNQAKNTEADNDYGKRVLQLTLTDGVQEVKAMEFKPIPCLSINLVPGTKMKIIGPVMVRNGTIMLEQDNVKNLGGSADDLNVKFAAENVLARALGLAENPNPRVIDENILEVTQANNQTIARTAQNPPIPNRTNINRQTIQNQVIPPEFEIDHELLQELEEDFGEGPDTMNTALNTKTRTCSSPDLFEEMKIDEDLLDKVISSSSQNTNKPKDEVITLDDSFGDIDIDSHLDHIDKEMATMPCSTQKIRDFKEQVKSPALKPQTSTPKLKVSKLQIGKKLTQSKINFGSSSDTNNKGRTNSEDDFENPFSIFTKSSQKRPPSFVPLDIPCTNKIEKPLNLSPSPQKSPAINIISIEKLKKMLPTINKGKFKIKAKFETVAEKLKTLETSFHLVITVKDLSGDLTVQVQSDIVAKFAETTPERLKELRESVLRRDKPAEAEIFQALRNLHSKCLELNGVLELQITRGEKYPVVINIIEV